MRLQYRGASYEYKFPSLEAREADISSPKRDASERCQTLRRSSYPIIYRGVQYTTDQVAAALSAPIARRASQQQLIYRGAHYTKAVDGTIELAAPTYPKIQIPKTVAPLFREVSRIHHANMQNNLDRRLKAARERGDQTLISMLEAESKQLAS